VVAAILHLGNIRFIEDQTSSYAQIPPLPVADPNVDVHKPLPPVRGGALDYCSLIAAVVI